MLADGNHNMKDNSFFSHLKDKSDPNSINKLPELESPKPIFEKKVTKNIKISPIEMILNQGRRDTPTMPPKAPEISRAPTPTINRPGFRGRIENGQTASRAQTPAPVLDGQW